MLVRAREILAHGPGALEGLPTPDELARRSGGERRRILSGLRVELFALSSILAESAVRRALRDRGTYPPYGLARSLFSDFRVLTAAPGPVGDGDVDSFHALGKALIDTTVFHLDRELKEQRSSDLAWIVEHLGRLIALFRVDAVPSTRARLRDPFSFLYGGLHFGTSTCVQLAEAMARLLDSLPALPADEKAAVIRRSSLPAHRLASVNVDHVVAAYQSLQPATPHGGRSGPAGWMDPGRLAVLESVGLPWKIGLRDEASVPGLTHPPEGVPARFPTQGCPARMSPAGGPSPISALWDWCADLVFETGLLGRQGPSPRRPPTPPAGTA